MKRYACAFFTATILALSSLNCSTITSGCDGEHGDALESDAGIGGAPGAVSDVGGSGGEHCVFTSDRNTGAENPTDCDQPADPSCSFAFCGGDGACHVRYFPIGSKCNDTESCDGHGNCKTLDVPCVGGCDDGNECTIDSCETDNGKCFYANKTEAYSCTSAGGPGHCNRDTGECCAAVIVVTTDPKFPDFKYYACAAACPVGQSPDPSTSVCN